MSFYTHTINVDTSSLDAALRDATRYWASWRFELFPGYHKPTPPPTPAQRMADEAYKLASEGHDVSSITRAIATIESERRAIAEKALQGALDLAKAKPAKARRFRLAYQDGSSGMEIVEGVAFDHDPDDKSRDHVFLGVTRAPRASLPHSGYASMKRLREILDDKKVVYRIDYID